MKKVFFYAGLLLASTMLLTSCEDDEEVKDGEEESPFIVLTFEDADYKADANMVGEKSWTSLIDNPQYGGPLLYPASAEDIYNWNDANHTFLASEFANTYGDGKFWGGGHAISNYVDMDLANGDFNHQLAVYYKDAKTGKGGHNGSANFCVHNGFQEYDMPGNGMHPYIYFMDGVDRVVDHMYVCATTYTMNAAINDGGLTEKLGATDWIKIKAMGTNTDGEVKTSEFYMAKDGKMIEGWQKWDLSSLGAVTMIEFNMSGSQTSNYGMVQPAYFAYDDVAVRK